MDRRELLAVAGGSVAAVLAGCLGDDSEDDATPTPDADGTGDDQDDTGTDGSSDDNGDDGSNDGGSNDGDDGSTNESGDGNSGDGSTDGSGDGTEGEDGTSGTGAGSPDDVPGEPLVTIETYVDAIDNGDEERAADLLHDDSRLSVESVQKDIETFQGAEITLGRSGIVSSESGLLVTRSVLQVEGGNEDLPEFVGLEMRLKQASDAEWGIYSASAYKITEEEPDTGNGDAGNESASAGG